MFDFDDAKADDEHYSKNAAWLYKKARGSCVDFSYYDAEMFENAAMEIMRLKLEINCLKAEKQAIENHYSNMLKAVKYV